MLKEVCNCKFISDEYLQKSQVRFYINPTVRNAKDWRYICLSVLVNILLNYLCLSLYVVGEFNSYRGVWSVLYNLTLNICILN